jgi:hypothetical protein
MSRTKGHAVEKTCKTCKHIFLVEFKLRNRRTYCSRTCAQRNPDTIEKMVISQKKTFDEKYGKHPMKLEATKENLRKSVREKHGVDWISQKEGWYDKIKENNVKKYGKEIFNNIDQIKKTCLDRYGVDNYKKTDEYKKKYKETCLKKYGVPHASQANSFKVEHSKTMFDKFMSHPRFVNFSPKFIIDDYIGVSGKDYKFKCNRCGTIKSYSLNNGKFPICPSCDKLNISTFQKEIYDFILSEYDQNILLNDRKILSPKELDIVLPDLKLAIECNGLVWHSEVIGRKNKLYHLNKTKLSIGRGYKLIHILDSEWRNKRDIVKSMILTSIHKTAKKYHGRKCEVKLVNSKECSKFIGENHIQGIDHSSIKLGLYFEKELLSVMTFVKSRFDKKIEWEMSRFCNKLNTHINGGASKLLSYFIKNYKPKTIVSYSDRRYFDGNLYSKLNFQFVHISPPNYYYVIDNYQNVQNRISWQKHKLKDKLKNFDSNLSEWENMKLNGFDRVWDCGNIKWVWKNKLEN